MPQDGPYDAAVVYSAKGTQLNQRGRETRRLLLDTAIRCLAEGGAEAVSANLIAKEAGVTWGTIQHQFGDADGVWAAVLDHQATETRALLAERPQTSDLRRRVADIVDTLWAAFDTDLARAVENLRLSLPRDPATLAAQYPATEAKLREFDERWAATWSDLFAGLPAPKAKVKRLSTMLPNAVRGMHAADQMASFATDSKVARTCLVDAVTAYLR